MAKTQKVIHKFTDMQAFVKDNNITKCREFPYFEGDYWPNVIEDKIKEIKTEEKDAAAGASGKKGSKKGAKKGDSKATKSKKGKSSSKKGKVSLAKGEEDLADRCFEVLEKHKDVFFIAYLNDPRSPQAAKDRPITDPDELIAIEMMDGRDGFLGMCRDEHREFSTLRRARHSSLVLLHNLHNADAQDFSFTCNNCEKPIDAMDYRYGNVFHSLTFQRSHRNILSSGGIALSARTMTSARNATRRLNTPTSWRSSDTG